MVHAIGYAAKTSSSELKPYEFERRQPKANDVLIDIQYCGICHSDVHQARNEWKNTVYPCMPGHEIIGVVQAVGSSVTKFSEGDLVGVGCMVDSCHECTNCKEGLEQYCEKGFLATYNGNGREPSKENLTYGGYSNKIVVREDFVLRIPKNLAPEIAGPILCAGVTTYSPLKYWKVGPGTKVGVVGIGGLGNMAVKLAVAMGAEVTAITSHAAKEKDARNMGAKHVILSSDSEAMKKGEKSLDFILSTIPQPHDANPFFSLLKRDGTLTVVGCIAPLTKPIDLSQLIMDRRKMGTSLIGSIEETQEVLDFCAKHNIGPDTKLIGVEEINEAFNQVDKGEVDYRFVIDMSSIEGKEENRPILEKLGFNAEDHGKH